MNDHRIGFAMHCDDDFTAQNKVTKEKKKDTDSRVVHREMSGVYCAERV